MRKKIIASILAFILVFFIFAVNAAADAGDYAGDYDFGDYGGDDYGGDYDGDYDYGGSGSTSLSDFIIVVVVVVIFIIFAMKKNPGASSGGGTPVNVGDRSTPQSELTPMDKYKETDPGFDAEAIKAKVSNIYVQMQNNWSKKDFSPMRPYFTDTLYAQFERQLQQKIDQKVTPHIDRISVQYVELRGFKQSGGLDHIIVRLQTRITVYTTKDATGEIVAGSPSQEKFMTYEWDIARTTGTKTVKDEHDGLDRSVCPSCGAPVNINASAKCEYCGSILSSSEHDWVISGITALSQKTV